MKEYIYGDPTRLGKRTTCYFVDREKNRILLGRKLEGIGKGNLVAIGGKVEEGETPLEAVKREILEEIGVTINDIEVFATLHFYFPHKPEWNQTVIAHLCSNWTGDPSPSDEIEPEWTDIDKIPFDEMWGDVRVYLPIILKGKKLEAEIEYDTDDSVKKMRFEII